MGKGYGKWLFEIAVFGITVGTLLWRFSTGMEEVDGLESAQESFFFRDSEDIKVSKRYGESMDSKAESTETVQKLIEKLSGDYFTDNEMGYVTEGGEKYRNFVIDNVFHSASNGDIHYNVYIPESYDGSRPYALYFTLPGYEGLYFQGVAANIKSEEFGFEAQKFNSEMIIVAPQLSDWGENSADQTIALMEYFLENYNIDRDKVYGNGYSGGGETMSIVMGKRPELFTAYLHVSSQWDGEYETVVEQRLPIYFAVGRNDEYYGLEPTQTVYDTLYRLYEQEGLGRSEIEELLVLDIKEHDYFTERNAPNEHGGGGFFAYDEEIMGWLFSKKGSKQEFTQPLTWQNVRNDDNTEEIKTGQSKEYPGAGRAGHSGFRYGKRFV